MTAPEEDNSETIEVLRAVFPELKITDGPFQFALDVEVTPLMPVKFTLETDEEGQEPGEFETKYIEGYTFQFNVPLRSANDFEITSSWITPSALALVSKRATSILKDTADPELDSVGTALLICDFVGIEAAQEYESTLLQKYHLKTKDNNEFESWKSMSERARCTHFRNLSFKCPACLEETEPCEGVTLDCDHSICKACMRDYATSVITGGDVSTLQCPACPVDKLKSISRLSRDDLKSLLFKEKVPNDVLRDVLPAPLFTKYERLRINVLFGRYSAMYPEHAVNCPKCEKWSFRENPQGDLAVCDHCSFFYCMNCRKAWHTEVVNCEGMLRDPPAQTVRQMLDPEFPEARKDRLAVKWGRANMNRAIERMLFGVERQPRDPRTRMLLERWPQMPSVRGDIDCRAIVPCPGCGVRCVKTYGCNHMTCRICYTSFCYLCGQKYGSGHYSNTQSPCYRGALQGLTPNGP